MGSIGILFFPAHRMAKPHRAVGAFTESEEVAWFDAPDTWSQIPSTTAERNGITSRGVHRCNNLLPSVYVMSLSTNVSICSSTALILLNFIVPLKEPILTPSFRPMPYSAPLVHRKFVRISEYFIGKPGMRIGIDLCSPQFDFLTSRSSPGECLIAVYIGPGRQNLSTAY